MNPNDDDPYDTDYTYPVSTGVPELNRKAFYEGYMARVRGDHHNPYPPNSNGWWHWEDGHETPCLSF